MQGYPVRFSVLEILRLGTELPQFSQGSSSSCLYLLQQPGQILAHLAVLPQTLLELVNDRFLFQNALRDVQLLHLSWRSRCGAGVFSTSWACRRRAVCWL